jgi:uncharacterized protein (TIGR02099 family)
MAARIMGWIGWIALIAVVLLASLWLVFRHWFWPGVDQWRPRIEQMLSAALETPVAIGELSSGFEGYRPSLRARAVRIGPPTDLALSVDEVSAVLSLSALGRGEAGLASLELSRPVIRVERIEERRFKVAGQLVDLDRTGSSEALAWLLASRSITVRNARIDWRDRASRDPVIIAGVDLLSTSNGMSHHFSLRAPAVGAGLHGLEFAADFNTASAADLADWTKWRGELYASAMQVQFVPLVGMVRRALSTADSQPQVIQSGSGPVKAWLRFADGRVTDTLVKTFTEAIDLRVGTGRITLRSLTAEAVAKFDESNLITITPRKLAAVDSAGFAFAIDEQSEQRVSIHRDTLLPVAGRLAWRGFEASRLLDAVRRLPLPDQWSATLSRVNANGRIGGATVSWDAAGHQFAVSMGFERLSVRRVERRGEPPSRWPAVTNLSGVAEFNDRSGEVRLNASGVVVRLPGVFAEPSVALGSLSGTLGWQIEPRDEAGASAIVELRSAGLNFSNADIAGSLDGRWRSAGSSSLGDIDLRASFSRVNTARVSAYLPVALDADVRRWVGRAVYAPGRAEAQLRLRGDLAEFPFRDSNRGEFRVETRLDQASLQFLPQWPAIDRIRGTLVFDRAAMDLNAESAESGGVALREIRARIGELSRPVLEVDGKAAGTVAAMLGYVKASPLASGLDPQVLSWHTEGNADLALRLDIGLEGGGAADYRGQVNFSDSRLRIAPQAPTLTAIAGEVNFDRAGIRADRLTAQLLGGGVQARVSAPSGAPIRIEAHGTALAPELTRQMGELGTGNTTTGHALTGRADWQASLDIRPQAVVGTLESRLQGIGSTLPEPFAKQVGEVWPLRLDWVRPRAAGRVETLRLALRNDVKAVLERHQTTGRQRAVLALGSEPHLPPDGIMLALRMSRLDLGAWGRVFEPTPPSTPGTASAVQVLPVSTGAVPNRAPQAAEADSILGVVDRISLIADTLVIGDKDFTGVVLGATRSDDRWRASVAAQEINGLVEWQPPTASLPAGALRGRLALLRVPRSRAGDIERMLDAPPARLPALDLDTERLILSGRELGRMSLRATNAADGDYPTWQLERLRIDHPGGTLDARGTWESSRLGLKRSTALDFELRFREPARLLETFGVTGAISAGGPGRLAGKVRWQGSPLAVDYGSLAGDIEIQAGKGQFLKTEPGFGKLIGVLNLQSLPRRLSLDFRDVFAEGFSFDEIEGRATIDSGIASTSNFRMRGVQAQVGIRGSVNIAEETQQLRVEVRPEMNAGLASLAYAAVANPAIGLGTFLAQWAFRKPLQDMFSYEYDVAGPWADPNVVERARPRFDVPAVPTPR